MSDITIFTSSLAEASSPLVDNLGDVLDLVQSETASVASTDPDDESTVSTAATPVCDEFSQYDGGSWTDYMREPEKDLVAEFESEEVPQNPWTGNPVIRLVDNAEGISTMLKDLLTTAEEQQVNTRYSGPDTLSGKTPSFYLDLEGVNLSRNGTISLIQLYNEPSRVVYIIDVHTLQETSFTTPVSSDSPSHTLKSFLEDAAIPKCLFDLRNDLDALFSLFGVAVKNVPDIQIMEYAAHPYANDGFGLIPREKINGLSRCFIDVNLPDTEEKFLRKVKTFGHNAFRSDYSVFNQRPLSKLMMYYSAQDVTHLGTLYRQYRADMHEKLYPLVMEASNARITECQSSGYKPRGEFDAVEKCHSKVKGPWKADSALLDKYWAAIDKAPKEGKFWDWNSKKVPPKMLFPEDEGYAEWVKEKSRR